MLDIFGQGARARCDPGLANAPLDQGAEDGDGGLDREPEVAKLTLGDGVADPLERRAPSPAGSSEYRAVV